VNVTGGVRAWGLRDAAAGKVLLWIDNPDQTFRNLNPGSRSGTVSTGGWANGTYTVEWWDTSKGVKVSSYDTQVQNGVLALSFSGLQGRRRRQDLSGRAGSDAAADGAHTAADGAPKPEPASAPSTSAGMTGTRRPTAGRCSSAPTPRSTSTGVWIARDGIGSDKFAVVWTGKVLPRYSETYSFTSTTDDGVRVWVNGKLIIDQWGHSRPGGPSAATSR
jgi:hypothetical protein